MVLESSPSNDSKDTRSSPSSREDDNDSVFSFVSNDSYDDESDESDSEERPYKHKEFLQMWRRCEEYCGEMTEEIESTRRVRGANNRMAPEDTNGQLKAQYGRLLPRAMKVRCLVNLRFIML